jgi:hypothetical protein
MSSSSTQAHDAAVAQLQLLADIIPPREVAHAFVASLSTRDLERRSALGTYALARVLPDHSLDPQPGTYATICRTCGWAEMPHAEEEEDPAHLERERTKYGGVRHDHVDYALLDLAQFRDLHQRDPTPEDWRCLQLILRTPTVLQPTAKPVDLARALKGVLPSTKDEREILVQILGYAGILCSPDKLRFFDDFIVPDGRVRPNTHFADWPFPVTWWRAGQGIRADAVEYWFPELTSAGAV